MIQCSIVGRETVPRQPHWQGFIEEYAKYLNNGKALMIVLPRGKTIKGLQNAWFKYCLANYGLNKAHTTSRSHELGTTVWLWHD